MVKRIIFLATLSMLILSGSFAGSSINPKRPNFRYKSKTKKVKVEKSYYNEKSLKSRFVGWGIDPSNKASINLLSAWKKFNNKREVVVAVVDTGIDPHHSFLSNNLYIPNGKANVRNFGIDFSKGHKNRFRPTDGHGHGTHVSGIVKSIFPEVKILTLKYYNPQASGQDNLTSTIEALRYAVNQNVDIINYSGGGPEPALEELKILKRAEEKGILVVAAAGNDESNIDDKNNAYYPASYGLKNIITVGAHNQNLTFIGSSNYGKRSVDLAAPGNRIKSALNHNRSGYLTGTSQATAFVTGVAALIKSNYPKLTSSQIKDIIISSVKTETTLVSKCSSGGRLDANNALITAKRVATPGLINGPNRGVANNYKKRRQGKIIYRKTN